MYVNYCEFTIVDSGKKFSTINYAILEYDVKTQPQMTGHVRLDFY